METTIRKMFAENQFCIAKDSSFCLLEDVSASKNYLQTIETFYNHLDNYLNVPNTHKYNFGHFLFEYLEETKLEIIDGKKRIITIIIMVSALLLELRAKRVLSVYEIENYETIVKRSITYKLKISSEVNQIFKDYVVDQITIDKSKVKSPFALNFISEFDYFTVKFYEKKEDYLVKLLNVILNANCSYKLAHKEILYL